MAAFYILGCVIILGLNFDFIIPAIKTICRLAFTPGAAAGGLVGRGIMMAMQYGIARGLFPMNQALALRLLPPQQRRQETRCARLLYPAQEPSGIQL